ncbi:MAG: hypothetical protein KGN01_08350 [Patescibacteria group bacterium]|nr:hypothetical protein [Patescibacteria group bacterium]
MDFQFFYFLHYDFLYIDKDGKRYDGVDEILLNATDLEMAVDAAQVLVGDLRKYNGLEIENPTVIVRFVQASLN